MVLVILAAVVLAVPNPAATPGKLAPGMTRARVCGTKWGRDVRHVPVSMKREAARRYGMAFPFVVRVEVDHKIPRELGGADDIDNTWPEPWLEARHVKDQEENAWHRRVCRGEVTLEAAQDYFRHWGER